MRDETFSLDYPFLRTRTIGMQAFRNGSRPDADTNTNIAIDCSDHTTIGTRSL